MFLYIHSLCINSIRLPCHKKSVLSLTGSNAFFNNRQYLVFMARTEFLYVHCWNIRSFRLKISPLFNRIFFIKVVLIFTFRRGLAKLTHQVNTGFLNFGIKGIFMKKMILLLCSYINLNKGKVFCCKNVLCCWAWSAQNGSCFECLSHSTVCLKSVWVPDLRHQRPLGGGFDSRIWNICVLG